MWSGEVEVLQSGVLPETTPIDGLDDPNLWEMRDFVYDDAGNVAHMFWDVRQVDSRLLPAAPVLSPEGDRETWRARRFSVPEAAVDRVTTRVRLRPMGLAVLDDLIESGDLDAAIRDAMPIFDVRPTVLEWTPQNAIDHPGYGSCVETLPDNCGAIVSGAEPPG